MLPTVIGLLCGGAVGFCAGFLLGVLARPANPRDMQFPIFLGILVGLAGTCGGAVVGWVWGLKRPARPDAISAQADYDDKSPPAAT